jgi:hypothetical protein
MKNKTPTEIGNNTGDAIGKLPREFVPGYVGKETPFEVKYNVSMYINGIGGAGSVYFSEVPPKDNDIQQTVAATFINMTSKGETDGTKMSAEILDEINQKGHKAVGVSVTDIHKKTSCI